MSYKPRTGIIINCLTCNIEVYIPKNRINKAKFCSLSCKGKHESIKIKASCLICGSLFEHISCRSNKAKYCSNTCRYQAHKDNGRTEYECRHCHKTFNAPLSTKRKYCSKTCVQKESHLTFKPKFTTVRKLMLTRGMITKCNRCQYDTEPKILGVHHKDRNRDNNIISNLEILCPNCHSLEHMKHINHGFTE